MTKMPKPYKLTSRKTGLLVWANEIKIVFDDGKPNDLCYEINDWLYFNRIKFQYNSAYTWYLKDDMDAMTFKLKWS